MNFVIPLQLFFIPIILSWSLPNFLFKYVTKYFSNLDIIVLYHLVYHSILLPFILYNIFAHTENYKQFLKNIKNQPKYLAIFIFGSVFLGLLAQYCYFKLIREYDVTTMIPIIRGSSAIVMLTIGYFIFRENVNLMKIIGVVFTLFGIYLISQN